MGRSTSDSTSGHRPSLQQLGPDLLYVSPARRWLSLLQPFAWSAAYFLLAAYRHWPGAVFCLACLSFVTYGSVSHDLVHRNLGLRPAVNDRFLIVIEWLALRSGTAYRLAHLHHHRRFPAEDDAEGAAAGMTFLGALVEGIGFQARLFRWGWLRFPTHRWQLGVEGGVILLLYLASILLLPVTAAPLMYVLLMTVGAWTIPLITSYLPHRPNGRDELHQTRAFRGRVLSLLALEHFYHLEHHLYPAVPHHNWPELARRLDPFLLRAGVTPIRLWF